MKDKRHPETTEPQSEASSDKPATSLSEHISGQWFIPVFPIVRVKKKPVESEKVKTDGKNECLKEKLARLQRWYDKGQAEDARYMLLCIDTFDWQDWDGGLYYVHATSLKEAVAFERKQLCGIDILIGVLELGKPLQDQIDAQGSVASCPFYPATGTRNVLDPVRGLRCQIENITSNLDYIESRACETGANSDRINRVLDCCFAQRGELDVISHTAQAMDKWECRVIENQEALLPEGVTVLGVNISGARHANEKIACEFNDLAIELKGEGHRSGTGKLVGDIDLLRALVMESAGNVFAACTDIRHALGLFEMLVDECNSGDEV